MTEAKTFLATANADLHTAALFFDHKEYPNAIYHIQQATEKLAKSFGLLNGWLNPHEKDIRSVGHNSKTIFTNVLNVQANDF
jgi:HEPN domain-containing protein